MNALKKTTSGQHPSVHAFRKKLDSIQDGALPILEALNARIDKMSSDPPSAVDLRREEGDEEIHVDVVEGLSEPDPFPSERAKEKS